MPKACTYVRDLTVNDKAELGVLCLLYDRVSLPHPYDHDPDCEAIMRLSWDNEGYREIERRRYRDWKLANKQLFGEGVLSVLPAPVAVSDLPSDIEAKLCKALGPTTMRLSSSDCLEGRIAIALHAIFSKTTDPEYTVALEGLPATHDIQEALVRQAIVWRAPLLGVIEPEQIIELRERTQPYRDGFRLYLAKLADQVEGRITSHTLDIDTAARRTFERVLEPEIEEFMRRRLPEQVKWWAKLLSKLMKSSTQVIETIETPFNYRNYPKIADTLLEVTGEIAAHRIEAQSNQRYAFQFLRRL
jgi:hypothetical protein